MNEQMKADLVRLIKEKLGASPTVEGIIAHLSSAKVIRTSTASGHVVHSEFYRIMAMPAIRTASDIEKELGARYDMTAENAKRIRLRYHSSRSRPSLKVGRKPA